MEVAIIGAGVSGLTTANLLKEKGIKSIIFEKENKPGGLIRCDRIEGSLFHICGGHIFNSKRQDVLDWFWNKLDKDKEFTKADRNAVVFMANGAEIPYPIENHIFLFDETIQRKCISDLLKIASSNYSTYENFEDFLKKRFGITLYDLYFNPYNQKIWRENLNNVPISWLEGKLPMPTAEEIIFNNINHVKEKKFVHSSFWYEKYNGSQFIADKLANGLDIKYNSNVDKLTYNQGKWLVNNEEFDRVVFCGNIKELPQIIQGIDISPFTTSIESLKFHGTTSVFCEIDKNPYSWIYLPDNRYRAHRIICTGNFAESNNMKGKMTATVEYTDYISINDIKKDLEKIPLNPRYITHHFNKYTYPIQEQNTRKMISELKRFLAKHKLYFTGRFADWEYYNMDIAMGAAIDNLKQVIK